MTALRESFRSVLKFVLTVAVLVFLVKWALAEYYISTHCTTVLGTRVCQ